MMLFYMGNTMKNLMKFLILLSISANFGDLVFARAGGGRSSSGSRGSRSSYSAPARSAPAPAARPAEAYKQQAPQQATPQIPQQKPSFLRSMAGGMAGGFLGSMLFSGMGFGRGGGMGGGGYGGGGGGMGIFEIILLAGLGYLIYRFVKNRMQSSNQSGTFENATPTSYSDYVPTTISRLPEDRSPSSSSSNSSSIDPDIKITADDLMDQFFKIQAAWSKRDLSAVKNNLDDVIRKDFQDKIDELKVQKKINKLESIAVRKTEIVESWREADNREFATVRVTANLLDYTIDETTNAVVEGSDKESVKFDEFWTFAKRSNESQWILTAIDQDQS